ncbi:MAG: right-handed parallel beta-helix repeat-containing protein [Ignavibacteriales bacterium]|nr:right-handed parallel beta-helix repeat-containing protein [Ignavibacteriales bacterium]
MKNVLTILFVLLSVSSLYSQTFVSGTITDTIWTRTASPYIVTSNATIPQNKTLAIDSGVTVRFQSNQGLYVNGTLNARHVLFTSGKDTVGGTPAKGDWNYIQVGNSSSGIAKFDTCKIRYGGTSYFPSANPNLYVYWGSATINGTDIMSSKNYGLLLNTSGAATITNSNIASCDWPIVYNGAGSLIFNNGNILTGNTHNGISLSYSGNSNSLVLDTVNIPYVLGSYMVYAGGSMHIASGNMLKFTSGGRLDVVGSLNAVASSGNNIQFSSYLDDNLGGDTNADGTATAPASRNWDGVVFEDASIDGSCLMTRCKITFAGSGNIGGITMYNASPTIDSCDMANNYYGAMMQYVSNPNFINNTIGSSVMVPIAMSFSANPNFVNNTFSFSDNAYDAIGLLGGTLPANAVLPIRSVTSIPNVTYLLLEAVTVPVGNSLTINKGIVIKGYSNYHRIIVQGKLTANATPDSMIVITSAKDDNFGNPGDSNKDGTQTTPTKGDWGGIVFEQGSDTTSILNYCRFQYASLPGSYYNTRYISGGTVTTVGTHPTISNCVLKDTYYGIYAFQSSRPKIINDTIINTTYTPIALSVSADPVFSGVHFINTTWTALGIVGENLGFDGTIRKRNVAGYDNITYVLLEDLTVNSGTNMTIDPGVIIKVNGSGIYVNGGFRAKGTTAGGQIVFTSLKDDNFGNPGDTNGDGAGTSPTWGNWQTIQFLATSDDGFCLIDSCLIKYGGSQYAGVTFTNAGGTLSHTILSDIYNYGIQCDGGATPTIDGVDIINCRLDPIAMSLTSDPTFLNITFAANGSKGIRILEGTLSSNATLNTRDVAGINNIAYIVGNLTIAPNAVLTIAPEVVIKFVNNGYSGIAVQGALIADGTAVQKIIFTSLPDDADGGDTNNDGNATQPARGNWNVIDFVSSSADSLNSFKNCEFRYGGNGVYAYNYTYGVIRVTNSKVVVDSSVIQQSNTTAIGVFGSANPTFSNLQINNISGCPVAMSMFSNPTFTNISALNIGYMALGIVPENYSVDDTIPVRNFAGYDNITYYLYTTCTVNSGTVLTIPEGLVFKNGDFTINGALVVNGTNSNPVIFTDDADDTFGNPADSKGDGSLTKPTIQGSQRIYFSDISNDSISIVNHAIIRYREGGITTLSSSPKITNTAFDKNNWGVYLQGVSDPIIDTCVFSNLTYAPLRTSLVSYPRSTANNIISGSTYKAIGVLDNETLVQDVTLVKRDFAGITNIPYLFGNYNIGTGAVLTFSPGLVIKFFSWTGMTVRKGLIAEGGSTPDSAIVFTDYRDDFYGGDTNADTTATSPYSSYNGWFGITYQDESLDPLCRLKNCIFRYAGLSYSTAAVTANNASPTIMYSSFSKNYDAIKATGSAKPVINYCDIFQNSNYGVNNVNKTFNIDARYNWWGNNSGPTHKDNPTGTGDAVTDSVRYLPYREIGAQQPIAGDVSLNGFVQAYDATVILQYVVDPFTYPLNSIQQKIADVSAAGGITSFDASLILQYVVGNILNFPSELGKNIPSTLPRVSASTVELGNPVTTTVSSVTVPIRVSGLHNLASVDIGLKYDSKILIPKEIKLASGVSTMLMQNKSDNGSLIIAIAGDKVTDIDGELLFVTFDIAREVRGSVKSQITFTKLLINEVDFSSSAVNRDITINGKPTEFALDQNYPNPFNPTTTIRYQIPEDGSHITLRVYNSIGELVTTLVDESKSAGEYQIDWNGTNNLGVPVANGMYIYRISATGNKNFTSVKKMLLMK